MQNGNTAGVTRVVGSLHFFLLEYNNNNNNNNNNNKNNNNKNNNNLSSSARLSRVIYETAIAVRYL